MKILGKPIAENIYSELRNTVEELKKQGTVPSLAVIFVGNNPRSVSYITQKKKQGEEIGAKVDILQFIENVSEQELINKIEEINNDSSVHGILIQQPLPKHLNARKLVELIKPEKEVDGLTKYSPHIFPLVNATLEVLQTIYNVILANEVRPESHANGSFVNWLKAKKIVILGKGNTGGGPIITKLKELGCNVTVIDSKTAEPEELTKEADIIISAVGKKNLIKAENIKQGVILLGLGIGKDDKGLYGDYDAKDIEHIASFYTPTPGGVGPVNVACLIQNLISATRKQA